MSTTRQRFTVGWRARVQGLLVLLGVAAALIGVGHSSAGRTLLASVSGGEASSCPFGSSKPASSDARRVLFERFKAEHAGPDRAPVRPARGLSFESTTRANIAGLAERLGFSCATSGMGMDLECKDVPLATLEPDAANAPSASVLLRFGPDDELRSIVVISKARVAEEAYARFDARRDALSRALGADAEVEGHDSVAALSAGLLRTVTAEYRFSNYYAALRATNMGENYAITEEYHAL